MKILCNFGYDVHNLVEFLFPAVSQQVICFVSAYQCRACSMIIRCLMQRSCLEAVKTTPASVFYPLFLLFSPAAVFLILTSCFHVFLSNCSAPSCLCIADLGIIYQFCQLAGKILPQILLHLLSEKGEVNYWKILSVKPDTKVHYISQLL